MDSIQRLDHNFLDVAVAFQECIIVVIIMMVIHMQHCRVSLSAPKYPYSKQTVSSGVQFMVVANEFYHLLPCSEETCELYISYWE